MLLRGRYPRIERMALGLRIEDSGRVWFYLVHYMYNLPERSYEYMQ
jgi:hypothetical protein